MFLDAFLKYNSELYFDNFTVKISEYNFTEAKLHVVEE